MISATRTDHAKALNIRREDLHALDPTGRGDRDRI
jgi:hypothetical protein